MNNEIQSHPSWYAAEVRVQESDVRKKTAYLRRSFYAIIGKGPEAVKEYEYFHFLSIIFDWEAKEVECKVNKTVQNQLADIRSEMKSINKKLTDLHKPVPTTVELTESEIQRPENTNADNPDEAVTAGNSLAFLDDLLLNVEK